MNQEEFSQVVSAYENAHDDKNEPLTLHSLLIKEKDQTFLHRYAGREGASDVRSISKTVLTIVLGIVMKEAQAGKYPAINEESYVYPFLADKIEIRQQENRQRFKKVKIKHLLTHRVGYGEVLLMRDDIKDRDPFTYLDYLVNYPLAYEPGEHYLYSNAGFYLLGVLLQEFVNEDLLTFIARELFSPLGIKEFKWEKYGDYLAGATRLWLLPEDLVKIGELLLQRGQFNGRQLFQPDWLDLMLTPSSLTPGVDTPAHTYRRYAYGHGIWLAKDEQKLFFGHGTDGQALVILPEKETVIVTLSEQVDMDPLEVVTNQVIEKYYS